MNNLFTLYCTYVCIAVECVSGHYVNKSSSLWKKHNFTCELFQENTCEIIWFSTCEIMCFFCNGCFYIFSVDGPLLWRTIWIQTKMNTWDLCQKSVSAYTLMVNSNPPCRSLDLGLGNTESEGWNTQPLRHVCLLSRRHFLKSKFAFPKLCFKNPKHWRSMRVGCIYCSQLYCVSMFVLGTPLTRLKNSLWACAEIKTFASRYTRRSFYSHSNRCLSN